MTDFWLPKPGVSIFYHVQLNLPLNGPHQWIRVFPNNLQYCAISKTPRFTSNEPDFGENATFFRISGGKKDKRQAYKTIYRRWLVSESHVFKKLGKMFGWTMPNYTRNEMRISKSSSQEVINSKIQILVQMILNMCRGQRGTTVSIAIFRTRWRFGHGLVLHFSQQCPWSC